MTPEITARIEQFVQEIIAGKSDEEAVDILEELSDAAQAAASRRDIEKSESDEPES